MPHLLRTLLVLATLLAAGCGPTLTNIGDYSMSVGEIIVVPVDPVGREQTLKIKATSSDNPIQVHVYPTEHDEAVGNAIVGNKPSEHVLGSEADTKNVNLEVVVPANTEVLVRLQPSGATSANVHLEITN